MIVKFYVDIAAPGDYKTSPDNALFATTHPGTIPEGFDRYMFKVEVPDALFEPKHKGELQANKLTTVFEEDATDD